MEPTNKYPKPFWDPTRLISSERGRENPAYAHTAKEEAQFAELGYTDQYSNYPHTDYPRRLYNVSGDSLIVVSKDEEQVKIALGYKREVVAKKPSRPAPTGIQVQADEHTTGRIEALEDQIGSLESDIAEIKAENEKTAVTLQEILAAVTK